MSALIAYLSLHGAELIALGAALHAAALIIVNLTPTPNDNKLYGRLYKVVEIVAGIVTKLAKR
jgi:hypothetical protein